MYSTMNTYPSEIQNFYKNQTIFLTGGTGFIGKVLIEKLLRICYDINKIYILVRSKKGKTAHQRFKEIFDLPCFDNMKSTRPNFHEKIELIDGNCDKPLFGIAHQHLEMLKKEVTIVVHAAADVRFDQALRTAAYSNIKAVQDMIALAKEMKELKAFIHVSTAYSNCPQINIKEQFYEPGMKAKNLFALLEAVDDETLTAMTPHFIKNWPNTYTFTKSIAEDLINTEARGLPVAVVRPAIILSTAEEPTPGWIDNFYGLNGLSIGIFVGAIKSLYCKKNSPLHCVPCDYIVNTIMAAVWDVSQRSTKDKDVIPIYNYVGSNKRLMLMEYLEDFAKRNIWKYPFSSVFLYPRIHFTENLFWHKVRIFFFHVVVSHIIDAVFVVFGKKRMAVRKYDQVNKLLQHTSYFTSTVMNFHYENVEKLWQEMSEGDRKLFRFNMDDFDWENFMVHSLVLARIYLLKERVEDIPYAKKKMVFLAIIHYALVGLFFYFVFRIISYFII